MVRPPRLTDRPLTGAYRTANGRNLRRGFLVSRADVAHLMLSVLDQPQTIGQALGVANWTAVEPAQPRSSSVTWKASSRAWLALRRGSQAVS